MNETKTTYEFWTLDGRHLETITTDDPASHIGELSHHYSVDADEIIWEVEGGE
ncbi:MAG: hypothetical protein KC421_13525 [Anaerolineales bacterium]|nr:hypothetical protein [Anaerolineales bacterium]